MSPLADSTDKAQQDIDQQGGPNLPTDAVGRVPKKVSQIERLLDLLEEDLNLPPGLVEFAYDRGAPFEMIRQKGHLTALSINLYPRRDPSGMSIVGEHDFLIGDHLSPNLSFVQEIENHFFLFPSYPENTAIRKLTQMLPIVVSTVKNHDFPGFEPSTECPGATSIL